MGSDFICPGHSKMELSTRGRLDGLSKALGAREIFISWTTQWSPVVAVDGGALTLMEMYL